MAKKKKSPARFKKCPVGTQIQTVLVPRKRFSGKAQVQRWLKSSGFKGHKIEKAANYWRIRQHSPSSFRAGSFRTISLGQHGTKAVIACPKTRKNPISTSIGSVSSLTDRINVKYDDLGYVVLGVGLLKSVAMDAEQAEHLAKLLLEAAEGAEGLTGKAWRKAKSKKKK